MKAALFAIAIFIFGLGCHHQEKFIDAPLKIRIPPGFPVLNFPQDNQPTQLRIKLGRILFYDNRLSANNSINCGSCHVASAAFTDGRMTSPGISGLNGKRNAPTLANIGWMPRLMMEGGVPTLETQALVPLHDSLEMGMNMMIAVRKLNDDDALIALSKAAYGRDTIDPYVVTRSLAAFQRTFVSGDTRYDRYKMGLKKEMSEIEIAGMNLFFSEKAQCGSCHHGVFLSDSAYHNIGLYEIYNDFGRMRVSHQAADEGKFKTPTLRNIALTAPYMHDGGIGTLEEVVTFYNSGGKDHPNKDPRVHALGLTVEEEHQLVSFLQTLTDWNFVQNQQYLPLEQQ